MNEPRSCTSPAEGERILAYELGLLPETERASFERHLLRCEPCLEDVWALAPYTSVADGRVLETRESWREDSGGEARERPEIRGPGPGARKRIRHRIWPESRSARFVAPVALAAILLAVLLRPGDEPASLARVETFPWVPVEVRATEESEAAGLFREAMELYVAGNRAGTIERLERAVATASPAWDDLDQARLYLGLSLLLEGRARESIPSLEAAVASPTRVISDRATWTLAQAHLVGGEVDRARKLLERLRNDASPGFAEKAVGQLLALDELGRNPRIVEEDEPR